MTDDGGTLVKELDCSRGLNPLLTLSTVIFRHLDSFLGLLDSLWIGHDGNRRLGSYGGDHNGQSQLLAIVWIRGQATQV